MNAQLKHYIFVTQQAVLAARARLALPDRIFVSGTVAPGYKGNPVLTVPKGNTVVVVPLSAGPLGLDEQVTLYDSLTRDSVAAAILAHGKTLVNAAFEARSAGKTAKADRFAKDNEVLLAAWRAIMNGQQGASK